MTFSFPARRRSALPIVACLVLTSLPALAQQQRFYGGTGYGTSAVGAYNPYTQSGPGQTTGRAYGAPPVAPYPPAYGPGTAQAPAPAPAGQVFAYNPWRPQAPGGYVPPAPGGYVPQATGGYAPPQAQFPGARPPVVAAPYGAYTDTDPGASRPPPPSGPIRSRLLSIPEVGNPRGPAVQLQTVPYEPRRVATAPPPPRPTVAAVRTPPAPAAVDTPPPAPTPTPRITNSPRSTAPVNPPVPPAPAIAAAPPEPAKPPAPPVVAAKPPEPPKPAAKPPEPPMPAPVVATAKPPEPPKPAVLPPPPPPPPPVVSVKPPEPPKPAPTPPPTKPPAVPAPTRVVFEPNTPALTPDARTSLDKLATDLLANPSRKMTLKSYSAGGVGAETRRLALARGLAVRAYLIDKGVPREQLDVQALGTSADSGPADRVDVVAGSGT